MKNSSRRKKNSIFRRLLAFMAMLGMFCCSFYPLTTDAADKSPSDTEAAAETTQTYKSGTLQADGKDYKVIVSYGKNAEIPDDASLKAEEIKEGTDQYDQYYDKTVSEIQENDADVKLSDVRFFDIQIQAADGSVIEPKDDVSVKISYDDPITAENDSTDYQVIHFTQTNGVENETPDMIQNVKTNESDSEVSEFSFKTDSFSTYGVAQTESVEESESESESESVSAESDETETDATSTVYNHVYRAAASSSSSDASVDAAPAAKKTLTDNGDGTYDITLSVTGQSQTTTSTNKINVVVVVDTSDSMTKDTDIPGNKRITAAQTAVKSLGESLAALNTDSSDPAVVVDLINFDGEATDHGQYTDLGKNSAFSTAVDTYVVVPDQPANNETGYNDDAVGTTNWEDALNKANSVTFAGREDVPTYVIFISDGDPTVRNTQHPTCYDSNGNVVNINWGQIGSNLGTESYPDYTFSSSYVSDYRFNNKSGVYGYGYCETTATWDGVTYRLNYQAALNEATNLVSSGKEFYTIAIFNNHYTDSSNLERMSDLTTESGAPADHYYDTNSEQGLNDALTSIAEEITKTAAFDGVVLHDTLTEMTAADVKIDGAASGEFVYSKTDADGNTVAWKTTDPPQATIDANGKIDWDLSSEGELEDGVTYSVTFRVWPNQDAYDLVAQMNNGLISYDDLSTDQKAQIVQNDDGTYSLNTNTTDTSCDFNTIKTVTPVSELPEGVEVGEETEETVDGVTYTVVYTENPEGGYLKTSKLPGNETIENPPAVELRDAAMTIQKQWSENVTDTDKQNINTITAVLTCDTEDYTTITLTKNDSGVWEATVHLAIGLTDSNSQDLDTGHDYTLKEIKIQYTDNTEKTIGDAGFSFTSESVHPMQDGTQAVEGGKSIDLPINYRGNDDQVLTITNTKNTPTTTEITLKKVKSGDPDTILSGVQFKLYKVDGENETLVGDTITSGDDGTLSLTDLSAGTYRLYETLAKDGYYLPTEPWTITVADDLSVTVTKPDGTTITADDSGQYQIENTEIYTLPNSGGIGTTPFKTVGLAFMLMAVLIYIHYSRQNRERGINK